MATTAIWDIKGWLGNVVKYAADPAKTILPYDDMNMIMEAAAADGIERGLIDVIEYAANGQKTDDGHLVSGINCDPAIARQEMTLVKKQWQKEGGIVAYHGYQSFKPGEVTPKQAHEIGLELANRLWGDRFQVVVATHLNTMCYHNHFVINSVSFADGKRYYDNKETYRLMRSTSDELCRARQLSVITTPQNRRMHYTEWAAEQKNNPTWRSAIREDVDKAIMVSMTWSAFIRALREQGYEIKTGVKHIAIRPAGKERYVRLRSLGERYTEEAIRQRILRQHSPRATPVPTPKSARKGRIYAVKVTGDFRLSKVTWKGLRALYYFYLRKLRKANQPYERVSYLIREDIRLLDKISEQNKFLWHHRIDSPEQLAECKKSAETEIAKLTGERRELNNKIRRRGISAEQKDALSSAAAGISAKLKYLRKEVQLCNGIEAQSREIAEKHRRLEEQADTQKEAKRKRGVEERR